MDHVIIAIDTHKSTHVAVAVDIQGKRLAACSIPANSKGYLELERWSQSLGDAHTFGIEGTGSYGAGLSRSLLEQGHNVVEVTRPNRQLRYLYGKSDSLDAESAARSVLNGQATAIAKTQTGSSEMIRHLKVARDSAVKAKSQAMITLKALIVNAPAELPVNRHAKLTPNRRPILPPPCAKQARRCVVPMQRSCGGPAWLWPGAMLGS